MTDMQRNDPDHHFMRPGSDGRDTGFPTLAQGRETVVVRHETAVPGRRRWPAVVTGAVLATILAALTLHVLAPTVEPAAKSSPAPASPVAGASTPATEAPAAAAPPAPAAAQLAEANTAAADLPAVEEGSFLHVVRVEANDGPQPGAVMHDDYIDASGWLWSRRSGDQSFWLLADHEPSDTAALPTDAAALDAELRAYGGNNSADERVFKAIHEILLTETASPALRTAAITALERIAENPQTPEITREGQTATPVLTVTRVPVDGSPDPGHRATLTDATSRPGIEFWLTLDASGQITQSGFTDEESTFTSTIISREVVVGLPPGFIEVLGSDHVEHEVDG